LGVYDYTPYRDKVVNGVFVFRAPFIKESHRRADSHATALALNRFNGSATQILSFFIESLD
jgi:hypothetical protein